MQATRRQGVFSDRILTAVAAVALPALFACVTVNVHFPESTVQRATDDYVRELYRSGGDTGSSGGEKTRKDSDSSSLNPGSAGGWISRIPSVSLIGLTAAVAAEPLFDRDALAQSAASAQSLQFNLKTEAAQKVLAGQRGRLDDVIKYKRQGYIGETRDGFLVVRGEEELAKKKLLLKRIEKLVEDENSDRKALYKEAVNANDSAEVKLSVVQKSFARSFQAESPSGTWVEDSEGAWGRKQ